MPIFSFECDKCGLEVDRMMKWSKKGMEDQVGLCECGSEKWNKIIKVAHSKTSVSDEERGANDLIGHSWR